MKDFFDRLGLVVHWFGFVCGCITFVAGMYMGFTNSGNSEVFLIAPLTLFVLTAMGWLIRYVISGKCHYLPYK